MNQLELHTGADIQDNNAGTDVMVARLTLNAFTGIGVTGASTGIDTDVALLEGQTGFGGMNISNAGAVTVGGVSDNFLGLWVFGSGDLTLTAGGTIDLADRNGAAAVHGGSQGGNVFLSANGAAADIVRTDGADAIMAQAGNVTAVNRPRYRARHGLGQSADGRGGRRQRDPVGRPRHHRQRPGRHRLGPLRPQHRRQPRLQPLVETSASADSPP